MPLSDQEIRRLFVLLEREGWFWRDNLIYSPKETMWLSGDKPWTHDVVDFYERMNGRLARIETTCGCDEAVSDTASLVSVLAAMQPDG